MMASFLPPFQGRRGLLFYCSLLPDGSITPGPLNVFTASFGIARATGQNKIYRPLGRRIGARRIFRKSFSHGLFQAASLICSGSELRSFGTTATRALVVMSRCLRRDNMPGLAAGLVLGYATAGSWISLSHN